MCRSTFSRGNLSKGKAPFRNYAEPIKGKMGVLPLLTNVSLDTSTREVASVMHPAVMGVESAQMCRSKCIAVEGLKRIRGYLYP